MCSVHLKHIFEYKKFPINSSMGEPVEALSALCNGQIRPKSCRHDWLGLFV